MAEEAKKSRFPLIPDKRYLTIGEVSKWCKVEPHVLRYWESIFTQLNPVRRRGRRFYRAQDLNTVRVIYTLLREKKYTIDGAQKKLREASGEHPPPDDRELLRSVRQELEEILKILK